MPAPSVLFYGALAFLIGVLLASLELSFQVVIIAAALAAAFSVLGLFAEQISRGYVRLTKSNMLALAALAPLMLVGAVYYHFDEVRFHASAVAPGSATIRGVVVNDPVLRGGYRSAVVSLDSPRRGSVLANLPPYPTVRYGDQLLLVGIVKRPEPAGYARYLAKERVSGVMSRPAVTIVARDQGSVIQGALFSLKHAVIGVFERVLPAEDASFLSGLTVGERGAFSKELTDAMQRSGTTHLVALSGYNIGILAQVVMAAALWFSPKRRRTAFAVTLLALLAFVCMAGAEASVVRAAIMGALFLVARQSGRLFDVRQAVVLAGLVMVLVNPKVLVFDVGFQLSFLAFLGIAYLAPLIKRYLSPGKDTSFFEWRTSLAETGAAQLAVAPLLIAQFGMVSVTSLIANLMILATVPVTMGVGFLTAALGASSIFLARIMGLVAWVLTRYEVGVIRLFSLISVPITPAVSWVGAAVYYALIVGCVVWTAHRYATIAKANQ